MDDKVRFSMLIFIAVLLLITAILSSLMKTDKSTNEYDWWVFLMVASWLGFGAITGLTIYMGCKVYGFDKIRERYHRFTGRGDKNNDENKDKPDDESEKAPPTEKP